MSAIVVIKLQTKMMAKNVIIVLDNLVPNRHVVHCDQRCSVFDNVGRKKVELLNKPKGLTKKIFFINLGGNNFHSYS